MSQLLARIVVQPQAGRYRPDSFVDLLQHEITLPGLDPSWRHTLIGVAIADDGSAAELTVHSEAHVPLSLDRNLRIVGSPPARVRSFDQDGALLAEGRYAAPLQSGQAVEVAGQHYTVQAVEWPGRHPETGMCAGDVDWQHVTLRPVDVAAVEPMAAVQ